MLHPVGRDADSSCPNVRSRPVLGSSAFKYPGSMPTAKQVIAPLYRRLPRPAMRRSRLEANRLRSRAAEARMRDALRDLEVFCLFVGQGRSGHSIVGALLDAHHEIVLPDTVDVFD